MHTQMLQPQIPQTTLITMPNRILNAPTLFAILLTTASLAGCAPAQKSETSTDTTAASLQAAQQEATQAEENASSDTIHSKPADIPEDLKEYEMTYELSKDGPIVTTYCKDAHVTVSFLKDDTPYRAFDSEVDLMGNNASKTCIKLQDLNFDNIQDILVPTSIGMHNAYYRAWLWNPTAGAFEEIPGFSNLGTPIVHPETQSLEFGTHISAMEYETIEYRLDGKTPVFWRSLHFVHDSASGEVTRTSKVSVEGRIVQKTAKVSAEEMKERSLENFQKEDAE